VLADREQLRDVVRDQGRRLRCFELHPSLTDSSPLSGRPTGS
jgi:hypothetical protein